ncbi:class I ribonucleotide reductase maintenance protein YfaE [Aestuariirhabdus sp. Z084]|uniref:class I ribonucleotide reductase maintenance protein YfaE n=1 Tax=Aestuariirhabdus haliotis TaxID=2918751 RepID=UPI00201B41F4|nr:class I ribonucleotide reductase maintenance protein YfaE [Aestuariirhabdus haliotis]MCL6416787.1 class I ribonucleotide reductase maintenance protein YfaE [Aestuariirhabdus haliotis]MCL6420787.1 class I ribonucleotide reductase maintenance protein YfaE [Aestuariirhabdus haliotis]
MTHIVKVMDGFSFMPREGQSLLEALESERIEIDYQCRQGFCGACQVDLLSGDVAYDQEPVAFVPPGRILPCCCRAQSDITIEIPESQRKTG